MAQINYAYVFIVKFIGALHCFVSDINFSGVKCDKVVNLVAIRSHLLTVQQHLAVIRLSNFEISLF